MNMLRKEGDINEEQYSIVDEKDPSFCSHFLAITKRRIRETTRSLTTFLFEVSKSSNNPHINIFNS